MPGRLRLTWGLLAIAAGSAAPAASAEALPAPSAQAQSTPFVVQTRLEPVQLPGGERMGLWTQSWLLAHEGWWLGPSVAAAATGQRGGLFVLGAQVARRWAWTDEGPGVAADQARNWLETSLYVGGGGGAAAPVGGGLMLAPALAWMHDWGGWQTGLSWSRVKFPSGRIGSSQVGLVLQWDGRWRWWPEAHFGEALVADPVSGGDTPGVLGWQRVQAQAAVLRPRGQGRIGLIGARAEHEVDGAQGLAWTLEAAAAAHGGADGYMEILAGGAWRTGLDGGRGPSAGARVALGLGGGGAVPTRGGGLAKLAADLRWPLGWTGASGLYAQLEGGLVLGPGGRTGEAAPGAHTVPGRYRATYAQAALGWDWGAELSPGEPRRVRGWRASASLQRQMAAARKDGRSAALDTVGLKLQPDDGATCQPLVQAHSAFAGGAGAYSLGLMGLGCASAPGPWRVGGEASLGAAGGGGVLTQGGAVAQAQLWLAGPGGWQLGVGRLRSIRRGTPGAPTLDSPVLDLSWTWRFGQARH